MELQKLLNREQFLALEIIVACQELPQRFNPESKHYDPEEVLEKINEYVSLLDERDEKPSSFITVFRDNIIRGKKEFDDLTKGEDTLVVTSKGYKETYYLRRHRSSDISVSVTEKLSCEFLWWWNYRGRWLRYPDPNQTPRNSVPSVTMYMTGEDDIDDLLEEKNPDYKYLKKSIKGVFDYGQITWFTFNGTRMTVLLDNNIISILLDYGQRQYVFPFGFLSATELQLPSPVFVPLTDTSNEMYKLTR